MTWCTYIFLDESGDFNFRGTGTSYFVLTGVSMRRPFPITNHLDSYKHDCLERGLSTEYFHCADDNSHVRNRLFGLIANELSGIHIDSLVVEKRKTNPVLREPRCFYPKMLNYLLNFVLPREIETGASQVIVITDTIPIKRKRQAVEKAIQVALAEKLPESMNYRILHHTSKSHYGLQIADYCCWAIFRKWERKKTRYYDHIKCAVKSEFDIFESGKTRYY